MDNRHLAQLNRAHLDARVKFIQMTILHSMLGLIHTLEDERVCSIFILLQITEQ